MERRIVGGLINTIGILAGLGGIVSAVMTLSPIVDMVKLTRLRSQPPGPGGSSLAFVGMIDLFSIVMFGSIALVCFAIAVAALDPRRRWREWRAESRRYGAHNERWHRTTG
jgi:ABC-type antimicrobial peptide transport system permease subunit